MDEGKHGEEKERQDEAGDDQNAGRTAAAGKKGVREARTQEYEYDENDDGRQRHTSEPGHDGRRLRSSRATRSGNGIESGGAREGQAFWG